MPPRTGTSGYHLDVNESPRRVRSLHPRLARRVETVARLQSATFGGASDRGPLNLQQICSKPSLSGCNIDRIV